MVFPPVFLAESASAGGFSFSGFQQTFQEAWDFVFPNALMLLLCFGVARFVGRIKFPWLRIPWDRTQERLKQAGTFLQESNLFGSKLLPALVVLAMVIATLDIFRVVRHAAGNLLPPDVVTTPSNLYARIASDDLLLRLFVRDKAISNGNDIYRQIAQWGEQLSHSQSMPGVENFKYWENESGDWSMRRGDFKLLAAVAIFSCVAGLRSKRWWSLPKAVVVLVVLAAGFTFCLAKELYAREQQAFAVLNSLELDLRSSGGTDWKPLLRKRAADLQEQEWWLTSPRRAPEPWWELRWVDQYFYQRAMVLFKNTMDFGSERGPLLRKEELKEWQDELKAGETLPPASSTPTATPAPP
jgi:hypothetical protein